MSFNKVFVCSAVVLLAFGTPHCACGQTDGGDILVADDGRATRLLSEPGGEREDNNGGATGALIIGDNGTGTPNYMLYGFDLSTYSGAMLSGDASFTFYNRFRVQFSQRGSVDDTITLSELAITNSDWDEGVGTISDDDDPADDGSASYANRVQFSGSGTSEPWLDADGNAASNLIGAITPIATRPGYDYFNALGTEYTITIPQATAQRWLDNGLAGLVMSATDPDLVNGDGMSRFSPAEDVTIRFPTVPSVLLGDVNRDGVVDFADIPAFIAVLQSGLFQAEADCDESGLVDFSDIPAFIAILQAS